MFSRIFGLHLLQKSRKMSKNLLFQNKIKTIPSRRSHQEISSEVFIKEENVAGKVPRGSSKGHHMDYTDSLLTVQK